MQRETLYLAVNYLDRFLAATRHVPKARLQIIGIACTYIAAKVQVDGFAVNASLTASGGDGAGTGRLCGHDGWPGHARDACAPGAQHSQGSPVAASQPCVTCGRYCSGD